MEREGAGNTCGRMMSVEGRAGKAPKLKNKWERNHATTPQWEELPSRDNWVEANEEGCCAATEDGAQQNV